MKEIAPALLAAQKAMPAIHKDSNAEVVGKTKDGKPYRYSYGYLSLQGLLEVVLPVLNENGLALVQMPSVADGGRQILRTYLYHESGELLQGETPLMVSGNETPQAWGGAITYARRYALTALLGIAADEDDDAQAASAPKKNSQPKKPSVAKTDDEPKAKPEALEEIDNLVNELASMRDVPRAQVIRALEESMGKPASQLGDTEGVMAIARLKNWRDKAMAA